MDCLCAKFGNHLIMGSNVLTFEGPRVIKILDKIGLSAKFA